MTLTDEQIESIKRDAHKPQTHGWSLVVSTAECLRIVAGGEKTASKALAGISADIIMTLLSALEAEKKRADEAEALIRLLEDDETVAIISSLRAEVERLREAGTNLLDRMFGTYKARNGREVSIQGDDGEKCWIVHSDEITALKAALTSKEKRDEN